MSSFGKKTRLFFFSNRTFILCGLPHTSRHCSTSESVKFIDVLPCAMIPFRSLVRLFCKSRRFAMCRHRRSTRNRRARPSYSASLSRTDTARAAPSTWTACPELGECHVSSLEKEVNHALDKSQSEKQQTCSFRSHCSKSFTSLK